jgi:response regulator of citrate/malate metabolism
MLKILLVMKRVDLLNTLRQYVEKCYPDSIIFTATKSKDALNLIRTMNEPIDLCFTEILMEEITGLKIVEELRRINRSSKAVLIAKDDHFALEGWNVGMNDYLIEPLTLESVQHTFISCS